MNDFIPSIKITLYLSAEEFDLDEVTNRLEITPTETRLKNNFPPQSIAADVARTLWCIDIKEENCIAVSILFEKLLNILDGKSEIIRAVCNDYNLETAFEVVIHMKDGDSPEVILPREVISFASAINAEIGFDLYCYE